MLLRMEPAFSIIERCGGVPVVAEWLGLNRSSVLRWTMSRAKGGTDGRVPGKHQARLLARAALAGARLAPQDFFQAGEIAA